MRNIKIESEISGVFLPLVLRMKLDLLFVEIRFYSSAGQEHAGMT